MTPNDNGNMAAALSLAALPITLNSHSKLHNHGQRFVSAAMEHHIHMWFLTFNSFSFIFGEIEDFPVGSWWKKRNDMCGDGVHGATRKGIHGRQKEGAYSIVL